MKRLLPFAALVVVSWSAPLLSYAADAPVWVAPTETAQATVQAIDPVARTVTLKTQDGRLITTPAGPNVTNLDKVKVGDIVQVSYTEAIAVPLRHREVRQDYGRDSTVAVLYADVVTAAHAGQYPTTSAKVEAVDASNGLITFRGPQGELRTIAMQDPTYRDHLHNVKVGDTIDLDYVEAVAVVVEPAPGQ